MIRVLLPALMFAECEEDCQCEISFGATSPCRSMACVHGQCVQTPCSTTIVVAPAMKLWPPNGGCWCYYSLHEFAMTQAALGVTTACQFYPSVTFDACAASAGTPSDERGCLYFPDWDVICMRGDPHVV